MADRAAENAILQHFQAFSQRAWPTSAIVGKFRYPRKTVNQCLYALSRRGLLQKVKDVPPVWQLKISPGPGPRPGVPGVPNSNKHVPMRQIFQEREACTGSAMPMPIRQRGAETPQDAQEIATSILSRLRQSPQPLATLVLARSIGCDEPNVQNILLQMFQQDMIIDVGRNPQKWILKNDPGSNIPSFHSIDGKSSASNSPPYKVAHLDSSESERIISGGKTSDGNGTTSSSSGNSVLEALERQALKNKEEDEVPVKQERTSFSMNYNNSSSAGRGKYPLPPHLLLQQHSSGSSAPRPGIHELMGLQEPQRQGPIGRGRMVYVSNQSNFTDFSGASTNEWRPPTCLGAFTKLKTESSNSSDAISNYTSEESRPLGNAYLTRKPITTTSRRKNCTEYDKIQGRSEDSEIDAVHQTTYTDKSDSSILVSKESARIKEELTSDIQDTTRMPPPLYSSSPQISKKSLMNIPQKMTNSQHTKKLSGTTIPLSPAALVAAQRGTTSDSGNILNAQANLLGALNPRYDYSPDNSFSSESSCSSTIPEVILPDNPLGLGVADLSNAECLTMNSDNYSALNRNPISVLTEFAQSRKTVAEIRVVMERGPPNRKKFHMAAFVGEKQFPVIVATSKKDGRKEAADVAIRLLMKDAQFNEPSTASPKTDSANLSAPGTHFDKMAALSHQAFNLLAATIPENMSGRKVLAALIMKRSSQDEGSVISLGTGNRCITGPEMSLEGHTVNDSHAEIVTRRGFLRFLYKQLCNYVPGKEHQLLEESSSGKIRVKPGITFHLYISTAPCGDGALFSPRDVGDKVTENDNRVHHDPTFTNNLQGVLRTKIEGGEGTIPIEPGCYTQTWDGILRGERLRTMSCSDKVCRWNILGMQGALLANFMEPVYLDTLTLGLLYDHGHLSRATCCRLEKATCDVTDDVTKLPEGYRVNHVHLGRVTSYAPQRGTDKTKAMSLNWCAGDRTVEMLDGTMGQVTTKNRTDVISRLAKKKLFAAYHLIATRLKSDLPEGQTYKEAKQKAHDFQLAKKAMFARFKRGKFGTWVQKPTEEKMFTFDPSY